MAKIDLSKLREKLSQQFQKAKDWGASRFAKRPEGGKLHLNEKFEGLKTQAREVTQKITQRLQGKTSGASSSSKSFKSDAFEWLATGSEKLKVFVQGEYIRKYGKLAVVVLCTYSAGDIAALLLEGFIPEPPRVRARNTIAPGGADQNYNFRQIVSRNLFNSRGLIPGEGTPTETQKPDPMLGPAVKSSLPITLIGTLILRDESKSLATIMDKGSSQIYPVRKNEEIPNLLKVLQVESRRVEFVNLKNNRKEYIDLPEEVNPINPVVRTQRSRGKGGIQQEAPNNFTIARDEINKSLANMNKILTQARAVPYTENGNLAGFKLIQIVPGSIYTKLGLQNGDVITAVDGENITGPERVFELFNNLKEIKNLELTVKRSGKQVNFNYDVQD